MNATIDKKIIAERELKFKTGLSKYLPEEALDIICSKLAHMPVFLKITRNRKTKLGDFRAAHQGNPHTISINHDLNKYSFLITLVHEMAHFECWQLHRNKVKPHGSEWKREYKKLMAGILEINFLPEDISKTLIKYMSNPLASSCTDLDLMRTLKNYNETSKIIFLEDLPENSFFTLNNKKVFQKGEKRRKLFKCKELHSKRIYLVNPLCEVKLVEPNTSGN